MFEKRGKYPVGTVVQHRNHYVRIKKQDGEWQSHHRWIAELQGDATGKSGELQEGEKVFHLNGKKDDNAAKNLIRIQFDTTKYYLKPLKTSQVLFIPTERKMYANNRKLEVVR